MKYKIEIFTYSDNGNESFLDSKQEFFFNDLKLALKKLKELKDSSYHPDNGIVIYDNFTVNKKHYIYKKWYFYELM